MLGATIKTHSWQPVMGCNSFEATPASKPDISCADAAEMLGVPVGILKWRVSEARHVLRLKMQQFGLVDTDVRVWK